MNELDDKVELNISNSLWVREGAEIKEDFLTANKDSFKASVTPLDFNKANAPDQINQWVSEATNKKIDKIINSPLPSDTIMYLINAIYFKGDWAEQFDSKNTAKAQFRAGNGSNNEVMMMSRTGKVEYGKGGDFQAVRLPYGKGKAAMYCILPEKDQTINDFIATLDTGRWKGIKESITERNEVNLQLPRFKLEYGIKNLNDSVTALGMGEAFTDKADFSGIGDNVCISRVLHKAVIEVNEEGSEAAAATAVEIRPTSVAEPLTFIADRPFLFVIADDQTAKTKTHNVTIIGETRQKQYDFEQTEYFRQRIKDRYKIEAKNAELKLSHGLGKCKYVGLRGMKLQIYFTAFVANVKRIVKLNEMVTA